MPNLKGGKAYKKTKHNSGDTETIFIGCADDQMYGRVIRNLGALNLLVLCNDNFERICHIRGALQRRSRLREGDIVIISLREFYDKGKNPHGDGKEKGDIISQCDPMHYSHIRKDPTLNPKIFVSLGNAVPVPSEGGFEFSDNEEGDKNVIVDDVIQHVNIRHGPTVNDNDDDVDIDVI
jgi:initiation factor 1A